jgi:hypothetical protein
MHAYSASSLRAGVGRCCLLALHAVRCHHCYKLWSQAEVHAEKEARLHGALSMRVIATVQYMFRRD